MAIVTCAMFTYAKYASGGDGSAAIAYTGGTMLKDYLAKAEITVERTSEKEYADGHLIDSEKIPVSVSMVMELVNNSDNIKTDVLGMKALGTGTGADLGLDDSDPPFVGAGCAFANRYKGVVTWECYWVYKVQFAHQGVSGETRRDRTSWQHDTMNGDGVLVEPSVGTKAYFAHKSGMTETAAEAWLKEHAGIS